MGSSGVMAYRLFFCFFLFFGIPQSYSQSTTVSCDFEQGNRCAWDSNDGLQQWKLGQGLVGTGMYALSGTEWGEGFIYVDSSSLPTPKEATVLHSRNLTAVKSDLTFYYRTHGFGVASLDLFIETNTKRYLLWSDPTRRPEWRLAKIKVCVEEEYKLFFEAKFLSKGFVIALDELELASEQGIFLPPSECVEPDVHTTVAPAEEPLLTASCNFESGICPLWDGRAGGNVDGEWELVYKNATAGVWASPEGPKNGEAYVLARGISKRSEMSSGIISLTQSSVGSLLGNITFWFNIYNVTPMPAESFEPYEFKLVSVSAADGFEEEIGSIGDAMISDGWVLWRSDFCLVESSYLKFVLVNPPHQLNFAIDEVFSIQIENGDVATCRPVTTRKPMPDISIVPLPSLPEGLQWESISSSSCDFDSGMCEGWLTPDGNYPFSFHTEGPTGTGSLVINEPHSGVGFAVTSCIFNNPFPNDVNSALQLPTVTVTKNTTLYGHISFWYVFVNVRGDNQNLQLLKQITPLKKETIWAVTDGQATLWRYAEVYFESVESFRLVFQVAHDRCSSPTALDSIITEQGLRIPEVEDTSNITVSCDFENDYLCAWNSSERPDEWQLGRGRVGSGIYALDGTDFGNGFVYVDSSNLSIPTRPARLATLNLPKIHNSMSFYYRVYGYGAASLTLFIETTTSRYLMWSDRTTRQAWRQANVPVCIEEPHKLVFEAKFLSRGFVIGLDHIELDGELFPSQLPPPTCVLPDPFVTTTVPPVTSTISPEVTPPNTTTAPNELPEPWEGKISCDFENSTLCDWRNVNINEQRELDWSVTTGLNVTYPVLAAVGSQFAVVQWRGWNYEWVARLISPSLPMNSVKNGVALLQYVFLVQFYYRTSGSNSKGINVYTATSNAMPHSPIWSCGIEAAGWWKLATIPVRVVENTSLQIIIETGFTRNSAWSAIDDIVLDGEDDQVVTYPTPTAPAPTLPSSLVTIAQATCSFEAGFCQSWLSSSGTYYLWREYIGLHFDGVPPQSGFGYVYVNSGTTGIDQDGGRDARLETSLFTNIAGKNTPVTIEFWYVAGQGRTTFEVRQQELQSQTWFSDWKEELFVDGSTEIVWRRAEVTFCLISEKESRQRLSFVVTPGANFSFAGLDEVVTYYNSDQEHTCGRKTLTCSFDQSFCGWSVRGFKIAPTFDSLASFSDTGFALASAENSASGAHVLQSQMVSLTASTQLSFRYIVGENGAAEFVNLLMYAVSEEGDHTILWRMDNGPQMIVGKWLPVRINLCLTGTFQIRFEVSIGKNGPGKFGIDDLVINSELSTISFKPTSFVCSPSPTSVPTISCSLDAVSRTFCGWNATETTGTTVAVSMITNVITSLTINGAVEEEFLSPAYLVLPVPEPSASEKFAVIESNKIETSAESGEFSFWYQIKDCQVELSLSEESTGTSTTLMLLNTSTVIWAPASYKFVEGNPANLTLRFRVEFTGSSEENRQDTIKGFFALDNVWYSEEPGFEPDPQSDMEHTTISKPNPTTTVVTEPPTNLTTVAPVVTEGSIVNSTTGVSIVTEPPTNLTTVTPVVTESPVAQTTTVTLPVTQRPPPVTSTTAVSAVTDTPLTESTTVVPKIFGLSKSDEILIGVGSAAGVMVVIAVFTLLCRKREGGSNEKNQTHQHHKANELTTRSTLANGNSLPMKKIIDGSVKFSKKDFDT